jgi:quercetin dioxygenase-like cupin family protein
MSQAAMIESKNVSADGSVPEVLADVNADLSRRVVVDTRQMAWEPSPSGSVWRKPIYRRGGEFGPVTSLVRYAPGGSFREHAHPEGAIYWTHWTQSLNPGTVAPHAALRADLHHRDP